MEQVFRPEDAILKEVRERGEKKGLPLIQVGKMDGLHLEVLTRAFGVKKAVEIGTLGGYSAISIARGMGPSGKLYTFELSPLHAQTAHESFERAGVSQQIEVIVGPASENLDKIKEKGPFDLVFLDADKTGYVSYLKWAAENLRIGGAVLADNTFAWGMIADDQFETDEDRLAAVALREFNLAMAQGGRFRSTLLPTGEGLTLGVKIK